MFLKTKSYILILCGLALFANSCKKYKNDDNNYVISADYSSAVLENYLKRSMTMDGIFNRPEEANEHIRMATATGAKHLSRTVYVKGNESELDLVLSAAEPLISQTHAEDHDIICEASIYNIISKDIEAGNRIQIPSDVLELFGEKTDTIRYFRFNEMVHEEVDTLNLGSEEGLLDISRVISRMWYFYLAQQYIDIGIEGINLMYFPNVIVNDTTSLGYAFEVVDNIRKYGESNGRRSFAIITAITNHSLIRGKKSILDFNSYYIRPKRGAEAIEVVQEYGFHDAIYGNSEGGTNPLGESIETLPYVVFFSSGTSNGKITSNHGDDYVWGYDEISWFSILKRKEQILFLETHADWVKRKDLVGFLQMPGVVPLFVNTPPYREQLFYANDKSSRIKNSYKLEKTIRKIWFTIYS